MKKLLLGILFLLVTCGISMAASWKECNTKLIMTNTQDALLIYTVRWLDHDIEKYKGRYVMRYNGELRPYEMNNVSGSDFRLCPGRHIVIWYKQNHDGVYNKYEFTVTKEMTQVILTPKEMIIVGV